MIDLKQHSLYKAMEVDTVLSSVFNIYFKKFLTLFIYSFIAVFIIQIIFYQLGFWELYKISLSDPNEILQVYSKLMGKIGIVTVVSVIVYGFLNAFLVNYLIKSDIDPKIPVGDIFVESIKKYSIHMIFFLILSSLILIVGVFFGIIALIIGAFFAMIYLGTVLIPGGAILVAEEKNAIDTIGRTFILTHKDFWSVLGSLVLFLLIMILISIILAAIMAIPFVIMFFENWQESGSFQDLFNTQMYDIGIWSVVLNSLVSAVTYPLYAIISVVLYFKLKFVEDQKAIQP
ncbi:hypothetical protein ACFLSE_07435 [Bacteroidota bacterium]